jgi:hypothetical protein
MPESVLAGRVLQTVHLGLGKIESRLTTSRQCAYCVVDELLDLLTEVIGLANAAALAGQPLKYAASDILMESTASEIRQAVAEGMGLA